MEHVVVVILVGATLPKKKKLTFNNQTKLNDHQTGSTFSVEIDLLEEELPRKAHA